VQLSVSPSGRVLSHGNRHVIISAGRLSALLTIFAACGSPRNREPEYVQGTQPTIDESGLHPILLTGEPLLDYAAIGSAGRLFFRDHMIWIADTRGNPFVHQVDVRRTSVVRSFGKNGQGPGDFQSVVAFSQRRGDAGGVWVFDMNARRLTRIADDPKAAPQVVGTSLAVVWMTWFGPDRILLVTGLDSAEFVVIDSTGRTRLHSAANWLGGDSVPTVERRNLSLSLHVCANPSQTRFAVVYAGAGRIELRDTALQFVQVASVPFPSLGVFVKDSSSGKLAQRMPREYYAACTSSEYFLYALFSGRHAGRGVQKANGRSVHVFDWMGNFVGAFALDHDAGAITTDGDSVLYTVSWDSDTVHKYRIPPNTFAARH
jgi:hypothetical protein